MAHSHHSSSSPPIPPSRLPARVIATSLVHSQSAPGDLSVVVPPVPIPNTAVKHHSANGSRTQGSARVGRCQIIKAAPRGGFFASARHDRSLAAGASVSDLDFLIEVGMGHWIAPPPPPNRTGGFPASGSPVSSLLHYGDWRFRVPGHQAGRRAQVSRSSGWASVDGRSHDRGLCHRDVF